MRFPCVLGDFLIIIGFCHFVSPENRINGNKSCVVCSKIDNPLVFLFGIPKNHI